MIVDIESVGVADKVQTDDNIIDQDTDIQSAHTDVIYKGMESVGVKDNVYTDNTRVTDKVYTDDTPDHNDDSTMIPSNHTDVNNEVMESVRNADRATCAAESAGMRLVERRGRKDNAGMQLVQTDERNPYGVPTACVIVERRLSGNLSGMQTVERRDFAITDPQESMTIKRPRPLRRRRVRDLEDSIKRPRPNIHVNDNDAQTGTSRAIKNEASFNSNVKEIPKQKTTTLPLDISDKTGHDLSIIHQ